MRKKKKIYRKRKKKGKKSNLEKRWIRDKFFYNLNHTLYYFKILVLGDCDSVTSTMVKIGNSLF